jgi:metallo-beta-lactamase family protein
LRPYWDREARGRLRAGRHPLAFEQLTTIDDHQTHMQVVEYLVSVQKQYHQSSRRRVASSAEFGSLDPGLRQGDGNLESHAFDIVSNHEKPRRPTTVIAGSGMCTGGRIVNYLKAMLGDKRTGVLFVGYQAAGTPGRDIQKYGPGQGYVVLDGERVDIRAGVHTLGGYSAHGDLVRFVNRMRHLRREVRLAHGDEGAKQALKQLLEQECPGVRVSIGRL